MDEIKKIIIWNDLKVWEDVEDITNPHETAWNSVNYQKSTYSILEIPKNLKVLKQTPEDDLLDTVFKK